MSKSGDSMNKRIIRILCLLLVTATCVSICPAFTPITAYALEYKKGDINGDGYITVADINKARNEISAKIELSDIEMVAADINVDTYNTVADINKMKNYISAKVDSLNTDLYNKKNAE